MIDGNGQLALPPFVDPHVHLDAALMAGEPMWNRSGTLSTVFQCRHGLVSLES
ncbi:MAG: hypothetical protein ACPGEF_07330 [Endozoicomonas sp.]